MGNLVNHSGYSLHFAHSLTNGDFLVVQGEKAVRAITDRDDFNGNRSRTPQGFQKNLIILHIARQVGGELRQRFSFCLRHIKDGYRLIHGNFDFLFLNDNLAVCIKHG